MIKHHPHTDLLLAHAKAELPLSMSIAIAAHCALCHECQSQVSQFTEQAAELAFVAQGDTLDQTPMNATDSSQDDALQQMLSQIMALPEATQTEDDYPVKSTVSLNHKNVRYEIPRVFRQHIAHPWQQIGKVSRMRFNVDENNTRASLLHIDALGEIPQHTHKGYELTLLLAGEFSDLHGQYVPGDFIILDGKTQHSPKTQSGCLCYTVLDAPLYFTKGLSKLLNPIGELIY
ncbi:ChrR family anti-sigma-E factor [Shewanella sp.]|uniref:ChrR family anti-sigma-E factor n=1 Tax=Shewanella sp. TaxID=50422 RepID=UPI003A88B1FE